MKLLCSYADRIPESVLPFGNFRIFSDMEGGFSPEEGIDIAKIPAEVREAVIRTAEEALDKPYPQVLASDFIRFYRYGNRSIFEKYYYGRREMLFRFAAAEAMEGKGRFIDRIMDGVWLVCDEADWVIPAHIPHEYALTPYVKKHTFIDLFSAETGSMLAWVYMLCRKALDALTPQICERLLDTLKERIIDPFLKYDMNWMGFDGGKVNNWNPWIISNILTVCALTEKDFSVRKAVVERSVRILDIFLDSYHSDGGCDEGPSYWGAAGASLFDCLELLYDLTDGKVDLFGETLIRRMGEYEMDFHISGKHYINFADCAPSLTPDYRMIMRFGRRTGSERLSDFGAHYCEVFEQRTEMSRWWLYRSVKNLLEEIPAGVSCTHAKQAWYDGISVMIERETDDPQKGFFLAVKGGHNAESHNHNDVGSFIVYSDGEPLVVDVGVGEYTKKTFGPDRYTIWSMCSDYHNLPTVNGVTQCPGMQFAAKNVVYSAEDHCISMDISDAYPKEAGLVGLKRTAKLEDGVITVTDSVSLSEPGEVVFTLMLGRKPLITEAGIELDDVLIEYPTGLSCEVDDFDMDMEDGSIRQRWGGRQLYRVLLKSGTFTDFDFTLKISKK